MLPRQGEAESIRLGFIIGASHSEAYLNSIKEAPLFASDVTEAISSALAGLSIHPSQVSETGAHDGRTPH